MNTLLTPPALAPSENPPSCNLLVTISLVVLKHKIVN